MKESVGYLHKKPYRIVRTPPPPSATFGWGFSKIANGGGEGGWRLGKGDGKFLLEMGVGFDLKNCCSLAL